MTIYAVNGKEPIAAWIPSLDEDGNGTTTLTDLVGSNNGALTNMDAATDWPADTDSGGVRALDFDGTGEGVIVPHNDLHNAGSAFSVSCWAKVDEISGGNQGLVSKSAATSNGYLLYAANTVGNMNIIFGADVGGYKAASGAGYYSLGEWFHVMGTFDGSTLRVYVNGALVASAPAVGTVDPSTTNLSIGTLYGTFSQDLGGRIDDVRLFDQVLDSDDAAYLATSRGIVASTGPSILDRVRLGNRAGRRGVRSSSDQHIARGIRIAHRGGIV